MHYKLLKSRKNIVFHDINDITKLNSSTLSNMIC